MITNAVSSDSKYSSYFRLVKRFRRLLLAYLGLLIVDAMFAVLSVVAIAPLADLFLGYDKNDWSSVTQLVARVFEFLGVEMGLVSAAIFVWLSMLFMVMISILVRWVTLLVKVRVTRALTLDLYDSLYFSHWEQIAFLNRGRLMNTMTQEVHKVGIAVQHASQIVVIIVRVVAFAAVPLFIAPQLVISALLVGLVVLVPFLALGRLSYKLGVKVVDAANRYTNYLKESIDGAKEVISFGRARETTEEAISRFGVKVGVENKSLLLGFTASQLYEPVGFLVITLIIIVGGSSDYPVTELGVVVWALIRVIPPIKQLVTVRHGLDNTLPSLAQVEAINRELAFNVKRDSGKHVIDEISEGIIFKQVGFSYNNKPVLTSIDLKIKAGQVVAIVGESGSGKSTLADILLRLLEPDSGSITVDGKRLVDIDKHSWRGLLGFVSQAPVLFDGSIRDNLLWANPDANESELRVACDAANVSGFIDTLSDGLDTEVGDMGIRLSGGQRQRVALARALVRKPELLILDEATSALDSENENAIYEHLFNNLSGQSVIIIAHQLSTILRSDYIYALKDGRVLQSGSYQDLSVQDGYFSNLLAFQKF